MRPKNNCPKCQGKANLVTVEEKRKRSYLLKPNHKLEDVVGNINGILHSDALIQTARVRYFTCSECGHDWREF